MAGSEEGSQDDEEGDEVMFDFNVQDHSFAAGGKDEEIVLMPVPSDPTEGLLLSAGAPSVHLAFTVVCWAFNTKAEVRGDLNRCRFTRGGGEEEWEPYDTEF